MMPAQRSRQHALMNPDEVLLSLKREELRQQQAVPLAYQHEKPTVSKGVAIWALMAVIIAMAVVLGLVVRP